MDEFLLKIPGSTSNLGPGFDSFGLSLPLYLTVRLRRSLSSRDHVSFAGEGFHPSQPIPADNLFLAAYHRGLARFADSPRRSYYDIALHNAIPLKRGLGSSGACVIAALLSAALVTEQFPSLDDILSLAVELEGHGDNVTPALLGGFTITLAGDSLCYRSYPVMPSLQALVIIPSLQLATSRARAVLPVTVPIGDARDNIARAALLVTALLLGDLSVLPEAARDALHQPYRQQLLPYLQPMIELSYAHGSLATFLSGSGPAFLCLVRAGGEELGECLCLAMEEDFSQPSRYQLLFLDSAGALVAAPGHGELSWKDSCRWQQSLRASRR